MADYTKRLIAIAMIFNYMIFIYITKAITDIRSNNERPDEKAINDYVIKNFATNFDESFIESIIKKC